MACIFNTVLLDLTAGNTDSFEGAGLIRGGGGLYLRIYPNPISNIEKSNPPMLFFTSAPLQCVIACPVVVVVEGSSLFLYSSITLFFSTNPAAWWWYRAQIT